MSGLANLIAFHDKKADRKLEPGSRFAESLSPWLWDQCIGRGGGVNRINHMSIWTSVEPVSNFSLPLLSYSNVERIRTHYFPQDMLCNGSDAGGLALSVCFDVPAGSRTQRHAPAVQGVSRLVEERNVLRVCCVVLADQRCRVPLDKHAYLTCGLNESHVENWNIVTHIDGIYDRACRARWAKKINKRNCVSPLLRAVDWDDYRVSCWASFSSWEMRLNFNLGICTSFLFFPQHHLFPV